MTEKKVVIQRNKTIEGLWVDSFYNNGGYGVVIDTDGDVHLVNFRDIKVIKDDRPQSES